MSRKASIVMLMSALVLLAGSPRMDASVAADVPRMLSDAKSQASRLKIDIATLDFFASSESGWKSHAAITGMYADRIAALRSLAASLASARQDASVWQQTTIDRIVPLLHGLAASAEATITTINNNQSRLGTGEYKEYLKVSADLANELSDMIGSSVDYGKTSEELQRLAAKVGAPQGPF